MLLGYDFPKIDASDFVALGRAVLPYLDTCRAEIAKGNIYPYEDDLERLQRLLKDIFASEETISGSTSGRITLSEALFEPPPKE